MCQLSSPAQPLALLRELCDGAPPHHRHRSHALLLLHLWICGSSLQEQVREAFCEKCLPLVSQDPAGCVRRLDGGGVPPAARLHLHLDRLPQRARCGTSSHLSAQGGRRRHGCLLDRSRGRSSSLLIIHPSSSILTILIIKIVWMPHVKHEGERTLGHSAKGFPVLRCWRWSRMAHWVRRVILLVPSSSASRGQSSC